MIVSKIITAALAHAAEEPDKDILFRNIEIPLINLGISELTDAENAFRANKDFTRPLSEPWYVDRPEDDLPYDWHITTMLLPLWLCWKIFESIDEPSRGEAYRVLYESKYNAVVPAVWDTSEAVRRCGDEA